MAEYLEVDKGTPVTIEVGFQVYTPFTGYAYSDATTPKITVYDCDGNKKVDAVALVKSDTGKYYYHVQTATTWAVGHYKVEITGTFSTLTDVTIAPRIFYLV